MVPQACRSLSVLVAPALPSPAHHSPAGWTPKDLASQASAQSPWLHPTSERSPWSFVVNKHPHHYFCHPISIPRALGDTCYLRCGPIQDLSQPARARGGLTPTRPHHMRLALQTHTPVLTETPEFCNQGHRGHMWSPAWWRDHICPVMSRTLSSGAGGQGEDTGERLSCVPGGRHIPNASLFPSCY